MKTQEEFDKQNFRIPDPTKTTIEDNALLLQSLPDESKHRICDNCGKNPSNHSVGNRKLCCKCFVGEGNAPADWHRGCMETYNRINNA